MSIRLIDVQLGSDNPYVDQPVLWELKAVTSEDVSLSWTAPEAAVGGEDYGAVWVAEEPTEFSVSGVLTGWYLNGDETDPVEALEALIAVARRKRPVYLSTGVVGGLVLVWIVSIDASRRNDVDQLEVSLKLRRAAKVKLSWVTIRLPRKRRRKKKGARKTSKTEVKKKFERVSLWPGSWQ